MRARLVVAMVVISTLAACATTEAENWRRMGHANFPARVTDIEFPNGATLKAGSCLTWGTWRACYGQALPIATYEGDEDKYINISTLRCHNAVEGERDCAVVLWKSTPRGWSTSCFLTIPNISNWLVPIGCPSRLIRS